MTISIYVIITALGKVDLLFGNVAVNENKGLWRYDMEGQKFYGYMRCSSREQNEDRQLIALKEMGISEKQIYMDKQSSREGILTDHNIKNYCGN
jgi:hypothetical protein